MFKIKYLLSLNRYSRSGKKTNDPKGIVLHHAENESYGGIETRNYFDNLRLGKNAVYYSTHYIVGFDGEIIYCVPEDEVAYHRGNSEESQGYISITCCNSNKASEPGSNALHSLKWLVRDIAGRNGFDINTDFLRHYDISGIKCPAFYVENNDKWLALKKEILKDASTSEYLQENSEEIAEKASRVLDIRKKVLQDVLEEKVGPDISTLLKVLEFCIGEQNDGSKAD